MRGRRSLGLPEEQQFARGSLPRWRTGAEATPTASIVAGRGELRRVNPAQMAANLGKWCAASCATPYTLRPCATSCLKWGALLEDVVADFGASIRPPGYHPRRARAGRGPPCHDAKAHKDLGPKPTGSRAAGRYLRARFLREKRLAKGGLRPAQAAR